MENQEINQIFETMVKTRRHIHKHPELSEHEYNTQKYIIQHLEHNNIEYQKIANTGIVAIVKGDQSGKTIGYRADIDALPIQEISDKEYASINKGIMHACGHDAHTAIALGTAIYYQNHKKELKGNLKILFQPAEESVGGAKPMVEQGCLENPKVDAVIGLHVMPDYQVGEIEIKYGTLNASTDTVTITVKGKSGHGAYPDKGVDAILIACQIVISAQSIISRNISPTQAGVISFGTINGGVKANVIADKVELVATIRSQNSKIRETLFKRIETLSKSIALSYGGDCEIQWSQDNYPPLVNYDEIVDIIKTAAETVVGKENVHTREQQSMGGEDFAFFIEKTKGAFYHVGCKIKDKPDYSLHTVDFDIDENCMKIALKMNIKIINQLLEG